MSFEILEPTKARLDDIEVLSQKNRQPDEAPGVKLHLVMTLSNHVLTTMDGFLKGTLFTRSEAHAPKPVVTKRKDNQTGTLDEVEPVSDLPNLSGIGRHLKKFTWHETVTGCAAEIRFATSKLSLDDCSVGEFKVKPKEGGSIELTFPLEAPNASEAVFAKLAKYKSREIEVMIVQHAPADDKQQQIPEGDKKDEKDDKPKGDPLADTPGNTPGFPPSGKAISTEKPPQSVTTEVVKDPVATTRRGRRVVAGVE